MTGNGRFNLNIPDSKGFYVAIGFGTENYLPPDNIFVML
jgi:hypothetical protein